MCIYLCKPEHTSLGTVLIKMDRSSVIFKKYYSAKLGILSGSQWERKGSKCSFSEWNGQVDLPFQVVLDEGQLNFSPVLIH